MLPLVQCEKADVLGLKGQNSMDDLQISIAKLNRQISLAIKLIIIAVIIQVVQSWFLYSNISKLNASVVALNDSIPQLINSVDKLNESIPKLTNSIDKLTNSIDKLNESIPKLNSSIDKLDKSISELNNSLDKINEDL